MKYACALLLVLMGGLIVGCGDKPDPIAQEELKQESKIKEIVTRSGGKWENLSTEDRNYIVNELNSGSEEGGRRFYEAAAGAAQGKGAPQQPGR